MSGGPRPDLADEAGESAYTPARTILTPDVGVGVKWFVPEDAMRHVLSPRVTDPIPASP